MKKITQIMLLFATVLGFSQPTTNAPTPSQLAANVISVYSNAYTNIATNYNPGWGQSGTVNTAFEAVAGSGNTIMVYSNFNYQGTDVATTNAAAMEYLHIDIWTSTATNVKVSPINNGSGASEFLVNVPLVNGGWSSVDLPKSAFTGMTWDSVFQMKFDGQGGTTPSTIYLDNIYFWKTAVNPASDATLSDLKVNGTTVTGFSPSTTTYTFSVPQGTTTVPQITTATTTNASATKVITQATAIPGSATVVVTSQNATATKTYTVNYIFDGPGVAAPNPPARNATDVISLFSNAYTNIPIDAWSAPWDDSNISDLQVAGNDTKKITFTNFIGIDFSGAGHHIDASTFTHFHMDIWTDTADLVGKVFNLKFSQWGGTSGEVSALELPLNTGTTPALVSGQWLSIDVPLSSWSNNTNRNDIAQFVITSNLGVVYFDNLYLYKGTPLSTNSFSNATLKMYPNPVSSGQQVVISEDTASVEIYNINGQLVSKDNGNIIQTSGLNAGVYMVKAINNSGLSKVSKLIVK